MLFRSKQMRWNFLLLLDLICIFLAFILGGLARFGTNHEWFLSNLYLTTFAVAELMGIIVFWISVSRQKFITGVGAFQNLVYCVTNGIMLAVFLVFYLLIPHTFRHYHQI